MRLRACLKLARQKNTEDTDDDSSSGESSAEEFWEWYEEREYDSFFFPPGMFAASGSGPAHAETLMSQDDDSLPRRGNDGQAHCWDDADYQGVQVRSRSYLKNSVKEQSKSPMLELRNVDLFKSDRGCVHYALSAQGGVPKIREQGDERFLFVLNFRLQSFGLTLTWALPEDASWRTGPEGRLFDSFRSMSDEARNGRLKLLPKVLEGPWYVSAAIPPKPVLVGRQCPTTYFVCHDHMEASIDCSTSSLGRKLSQLLTAGHCVVALFVILEGLSEEELPERIFGGAAVFRTDAARIPSR